MAKMSTLTETFTTKDEAKWKNASDYGPWGATQRITAGTLEIDCTSNYGIKLQSALNFDITNDYAYCEIVQRPTQGGDNSTEMHFILADGDFTTGKQYEFVLTGGGGIVMRYVVNNTEQTGSAFTTYSTVNHKWLRFLHSGTTLTMQGGQTATGPWVNLHSYATLGWDMTNSKIVFQSAYWGTQAAAGTARFDNFNTDGVVATPTTPTNLFFPFIGAS